MFDRVNLTSTYFNKSIAFKSKDMTAICDKVSN